MIMESHFSQMLDDERWWDARLPRLARSLRHAALVSDRGHYLIDLDHLMRATQRPSVSNSAFVNFIVRHVADKCSMSTYESGLSFDWRLES